MDGFAKWANEQLEHFPSGVSLRSRGAFATWLEVNAPYVIAAFMLNSRALRVCSGISPAFAEVAAANGWPAVTVSVPRHFKNVILVKEGFVDLDLSAIQFEVCDHNDFKEVARVLRSVARNPFRAIRVGFIEPGFEWPIGQPRLPTGKFDSLYNPVKTFEFVRKYGLEDFPELMAEVDSSGLDVIR